MHEEVLCDLDGVPGLIVVGQELYERPIVEPARRLIEREREHARLHSSPTRDRGPPLRARRTRGAASLRAFRAIGRSAAAGQRVKG
jgi:hypothetical protein